MNVQETKKESFNYVPKEAYPTVPSNFRPEDLNLEDQDIARLIKLKYSCVVPNCPTKYWSCLYRIGLQNKSLHIFPRDQKRRQSWIENIRQATGWSIDWEKAENKYVCEDHFAEEAKSFSGKLCGPPTLFPLEINDDLIDFDDESLTAEEALAAHDYCPMDVDIESFHTPCPSPHESVDMDKLNIIKQVVKEHNYCIYKFDHNRKRKKTKYIERFNRARKCLEKVCFKNKYTIDPTLKYFVKHRLGIVDIPNFINLKKKRYWFDKTTHYTQLRNSMVLPYGASLKALLHNLPLKRGINPLVFKRLSKKLRTKKKSDRICVLQFAKYILKSSKQNRPAQKAIIFMLKGIQNNWQQPIAFYVANSVVLLKFALYEVLSQLSQIGANIVALSCHHNKSNRQLIKQIALNKPYFEFKSQKIFILFDPSGLLASTKNTLMSYRILFKPNTLASFFWIRKCFEVHATARFPLLAQLRMKYLRHKTKDLRTRNGVARRIFSYETSCCLENMMKPKALNTAEFVAEMDMLYKSLCEPCNFRKFKYVAFKARNIRLWKTVKNKKIVTKLAVKIGWLKTIRNCKLLLRYCDRLGLKEVNLKALHLDTLEKFICDIRIFGNGNRRRLDALEFTAGYKMALLSRPRFFLDNYRDLFKS